MRISDWSSDVCSSDLFDGEDCQFIYEVHGLRSHCARLRERTSQVVQEGPRVRVCPCHARHCGPFQLEAHFVGRSEEHTSELQSLMSISYAVFCLKKKTTNE